MNHRRTGLILSKVGWIDRKCTLTLRTVTIIQRRWYGLTRVNRLLKNSRKCSLKGGDPAAGSPTATLLRLHPSRSSDLGRLLPRKVSSTTSGPINSHGVTGGVYKARERIHRGNADPRLLAIPTSRSRVADCDPDYERLYGIGSPSRVGDPLYRPL